MVYRRKRTFRKKGSSSKRTYGRRRVYRKKTPANGSIRILRWSSKDSTNNCHKTLTGNDAIPALDGSEVFTLGDLNGSGEITSLFDNYRITKVLYRWVLLKSPDGATTATNKFIYPRIVWKHDFNDQLVINRTQMYQNANIKEAYFGDNMMKTRWYPLNPSVDMSAYISSVATGYSPKWRQWLDTSYSTLPHYGIKYCYSDLYAGMTIRMEAKLVLECKGVS